MQKAEFKTLDEVWGYLDAVIRAARSEFRIGIVMRSPRRAVTTSRARGGDGRGSIALARYHWNRAVALHELAHIIAPTDVRHGWQFARIYLRLVQRFLGDAEARRLRQEFVAGGVRYRKPVKRPPLSPAQKAVLVARLRTARERKLAAACAPSPSPTAP